MSVLDEMISCLQSHDPASRVLGNVMAGDALAVIHLLLSSAEGGRGLFSDHAAEIARLTAEVERLRGAMAADDERLRLAAERVGIVAGCDAPEHMADEVKRLRARCGRLAAEVRAWRFEDQADKDLNFIGYEDAYTLRRKASRECDAHNDLKEPTDG